ncbi:MAG: antibiotic biosynthesis monooxygenase (ABM) superfamily enzyme [Motiliproteus sp.]|jgi:antibiotic biosynthesis monooxygenase (ABM) superfamily enzyme
MAKKEKIISIVRNRVRSEKINEYLSWQKKMTLACEKFEGYINTTLIEPGSLTQDPDEYIVILRFRNNALMSIWIKSTIRNNLLIESESFTLETPVIKTFSGIEHWFIAADKTPSRIKMTLVSFCAIWPLVHFIPAALSPLLDFSDLINETLTTAVITVCMSYIALPAMTKLFRRWL